MEIKIRAWDKVKKKMFYPRIVWCLDILGNNSYECAIEKAERMLYTGLRDKNGREICEGDIINDGYGGHVVYDEKFTGFFIENSHAVRLRLFQEMQPSLDGKDRYVIGNIHENPELLR